MFQFTEEMLEEADRDENKNSKWVRDTEWKNQEVVTFQVVDTFRVEDAKPEGKRFHVRQELKVLSGEHEGRDYTHTWWDIGGVQLNQKTKIFLTRALKNLGLGKAAMAGKDLDDVLPACVGLRFQAKCTQKPKQNGNGHYTSWWEHKPV